VKACSVVSIVSEEFITAIFRLNSTPDTEAIRCKTTRSHKAQTTIYTFTAVITQNFRSQNAIYWETPPIYVT
jgi:hypothetical protein